MFIHNYCLQIKTALGSYANFAHKQRFAKKMTAHDTGEITVDI